MSVDSWSGGEKKIARRAFDAALEKEFAALIVQIKEMTATLVHAVEHPPEGERIIGVPEIARARMREAA